MKARILKALDFLRLLDEAGCLSLTNIAVMVVLVKVAMSQFPSFAELAALLTVLSTYTFKRYTQRKHRYSKEPKIEIAANLDRVKLDAMSNDLERLKLAAGFKKHVSTENPR